MTKKEESVENRIVAAETLAYLIATSASLQRIAAISNHLIPSMASFLNFDNSSNSNNDGVGVNSASDAATSTSSNSNLYSSNFYFNKYQQQHTMANSGRSLGEQENFAKRMRQAAFRVFASLGANDEEIRKRIIETDNLMPNLVKSLEDSEEDMQIAAIKCLHSLSRSVQLLRTTFQDHPVWKPLMNMLGASSTSLENMTVASSTLCNLLLEFSPSKEPILDLGAIQLLCQLSRKLEPQLRLNGVWGLMVRKYIKKCCYFSPSHES